MLRGRGGRIDDVPTSPQVDDAEPHVVRKTTASPRRRAARACGGKEAGVDAVSRFRIRTVEPYTRTMTKDPISQLNRPRPRAAERVVLVR